MKKYLIVIAILAIIQGCSVQYVDLYKTTAVNTKKTDSVYVYENDTLRIDYKFWEDGGMIQYRVANKSDKPIYIDWKKSAVITREGRYDYWSDKSASNVSFRLHIHDEDAFPPIQDFASIANVNVKDTRRERVTFMPPKSYIVLTLTPVVRSYQNISKEHSDFEQHTEARHDDPKVETTIYSKKYSKDNSTVCFRNFLTFSFSEDFAHEFYADNEFYVNEIDAMDENHFSHRELDKKKDVIQIDSYRQATDFYKRPR